MRVNLKIFRIMRGMNQNKMAQRLGVCRSYYGHIERGFMDGSSNFWARLKKSFALTDEQIEELKAVDN